jgi:hypothetical protein
MGAITAAVEELAALSVRVLSPADPRIVAQQGEFLFVASDPISSVQLVQNRHLDCIKVSDFLWLVAPDRYVGSSASMEIGCAVTAGVPILSTHAPSDLTLRQYVTIVPKLSDAARLISARPRRQRPESFFVDPHASAEEAHSMLDRICAALTRPGAVEPERYVYHDMAKLQRMIASPKYIQ